MRAVFVTTRTNDVASVISAWDSFNEPSKRVSYLHYGDNEDPILLSRVLEINPDIIFYIGAVSGTGVPTVDTLKRLRKIAPSVNLCFDGGDPPWYPVLESYRDFGCFDFQVSIDGQKQAPVDLVTVAPVDPRPFDKAVEKDILCGFSGNFFREDPRGRILTPLFQHGVVTIRNRMVEGETLDGHDDHVAFMLRCKMSINTSYAGSGKGHHLKQRVIECGFAGCAVLETAASPISDWFPEGAYFTYDSVDRAKELIETLSDEDISARAKLHSAHVKANYTPEKIYSQILDRL